MTLAKVVEQGGFQAIQLPPEFRIAGGEIEILRRGDEIVLRQVRHGLSEVFDILTSLSEDFMTFERNQPSMQEREMF